MLLKDTKALRFIEELIRFVFLNTKGTKVYLTTKTLIKITKSTRALRFIEELIRFVFLNTKGTKVYLTTKSTKFNHKEHKVLRIKNTNWNKKARISNPPSGLIIIILYSSHLTNLMNSKGSDIGAF